MFKTVDTEVIGISADAKFSPQASDAPDAKTIQAYGVLNPNSKLAQRSYFIVDKKGIVRFKKLQERGEPLQTNDRLVEEIRKINQAN
jgi:alkyl hydroperoxide reductase subunit AhpC